MKLGWQMSAPVCNPLPMAVIKGIHELMKHFPGLWFLVNPRFAPVRPLL